MSTSVFTGFTLRKNYEKTVVHLSFLVISEDEGGVESTLCCVL